MHAPINLTNPGQNPQEMLLDVDVVPRQGTELAHPKVGFLATNRERSARYAAVADVRVLKPLSDRRNVVIMTPVDACPTFLYSHLEI